MANPAMSAHTAAPPADKPAYDPLYDPARDAHAWTPPLDVALTCARQSLAQHESANIHDDNAMLRAATGLQYVLRDLLAALDAGDSQ